MLGALNRSYGLADLGRAGLGNKLFPWARCLLWCEATGARMLPAGFFQLPIGPLLRGERDLRLYSGLFRRPPARDLAVRVLARQLLAEVPEGVQAPPRTVVRFSGLASHFAPLNGKNEVVFRAFRELVLPRWVSAAEAAPRPTIAVHVRLGDFSGNMRHPVEWYLEALQFVRRLVGRPVRAHIFSDGREDELAPLLRESETVLVRSPNAVTDLLHLARARFLIGTGSSTFGAWAVYFGGMPAICRTGNPFKWWKLENPAGECLDEVDFARPAPAIVESIKKVLGPQL